MFKMMSYGEFPVDTSRVRPPDAVQLTMKASPWLKMAYEWCIPGLLLGSILMWTRRRNR